ncbi:hypothetical protein D3C74_480410 [compost metagenome]
MLEAGRFNVEFQVFVSDRPALGNGLFHIPVTATGRAAMIVTMHLTPFIGFLLKGPNNLWIGSA